VKDTGDTLSMDHMTFGAWYITCWAYCILGISHIGNDVQTRMLWHASAPSHCLICWKLGSIG